jgi:hypothetical protein
MELYLKSILFCENFNTRSIKMKSPENQHSGKPQHNKNSGHSQDSNRHLEDSEKHPYEHPYDSNKRSQDKSSGDYGKPQSDSKDRSKH